MQSAYANSNKKTEEEKNLLLADNNEQICYYETLTCKISLNRLYILQCFIKKKERNKKMKKGFNTSIHRWKIPRNISFLHEYQLFQLA